MATTAVMTGPIRVQELLEDFPSGQDGACVLFLGVVRNHNDGKPVTGLEYQAYETMAEGVLAAIAKETSERFGTDRIAILHRTGALEVGEIATAIAVATPHREEAYGASRYVIEEIKKRLPIWKKEHYISGEARWVGEATGDGGGE